MKATVTRRPVRIVRANHPNAWQHGCVDWKRLGKAVTRRRVQLGYPTLVSFSEAAGFSTRLLGDLEGGRRGSYDPATLARVERVLAWPPGAVDSILAGDVEPAANVMYGDPDQFPPFRVDFDGTDPTLNPARPLDAKLIVLRLHDAALPPEDRARLLATLTVVLEWTQARLDAAKSVEELAEGDRVLGEMPVGRPSKAEVRERHDVGR